MDFFPKWIFWLIVSTLDYSQNYGPPPTQSGGYNANGYSYPQQGYQQPPAEYDQSGYSQDYK